MKLKLILPTAVASFLAACAVVPPKPGTEAHQKMLEDQARENFYALKAREHPSRPAPVITQAEPPPKVRLQPFNPFVATHAAPAPTPAPKPVALSKPVPAATPVPPKKPVVSVAPPPAPKPVAPSKPIAVAKPEPTPKPLPPARPVAAAKPAPSRKPSNSLTFSNPFARAEKPRPSDETVYLYDMPRGPEPNSPRYHAYKVQYAHELAKRPEDLTPEEREWVRRHYRD